MSQMLLAIDQGTTGTAVAYFDFETLSPLAHHKVEYRQIYPQPGWVEHDPEDIWTSLLQALAGATAKLGTAHPHRDARAIAAIGITNQRETCLAWNRRTGEAAGNAIVWQDRRTAEFCDAMKSNGPLREEIARTTGLVCDPYFSGSKMRHMMHTYPKAQSWAKSGELALGTIDSYLVHRLSGRASFVTEHTNASRTMLYGLASGGFEDRLCALFDVPRAALPEIRDSCGLFGVTKGVPGLADGLPVTGILGDQQAALFGQNCERPGEAKITYGTGAFLLMHTGHRPVFSADGLLTTVALARNGERTFALEGAAFIAGAAVQFLRDQFQFIQSASEIESLAASQPRDPHVLFVPALAGLSAPYWNPRAKGVLFGLTRGTSRAQIARAVLESVALQNAQLLSLMEKASQETLVSVGVDGGAAANDALMQFQADILRVALTRPTDTETTSQGAARAARLGLAPEKPAHKAPVSRTFVPSMDEADARARVTQWLRAADCVNGFYSSMM